MGLLGIVHAAFQAALRAGDAGPAVAVRLTVRPAVDEEPDALLATALSSALDWLGDACETLLVWDSGTGSALAHLACARGGTALVSLAPSGPREIASRVEAIVVGSRGVLSWEGGAETSGLETTAAGPPVLPAEVERAWRRSRAEAAVVHVPTGTVRAPRSQPALALAGAGRDRFPPLPPPYGVLLVSGGYTHQESYAAALAADARVRLVAIADESGLDARRRAANQRLAQQFGLPYLEDLDAALARPDVQIVSVCAEPERRARIAVHAARAGKALYLDKPLCVSAAEALEVVRAVEASGQQAQMFSLWTHPFAERVRRAWAAGEGWDAAHCDLFFAKGHPGTAALGAPRRETAVPASIEGPETKRELANIGVYPLVLLDRLTGQRPRKVFASTSNYFFAAHQQADREDFGAVLVEYENGFRASLCVGRTGWQSHPAGGAHRVCLAGRAGLVSLDAWRPRVEVAAHVPPFVAPPAHPDDPMGFWASTQHVVARPKQVWFTPPQASREDAASFLDHLEQGTPCEVNVRPAARVMETLSACYLSAATGQVVELT